MHGASTARRLAGRALRALPPAASLVALGRAELAARRLVAGMPERRPLLVYQMGKVGSSTVLRTLRETPGLQRPLVHAHYLEPAFVRRIRSEQVRDAGWMRVEPSWGTRPRHRATLRAPGRPAPGQPDG